MAKKKNKKKAASTSKKVAKKVTKKKVSKKPATKVTKKKAAPKKALKKKVTKKKVTAKASASKVTKKKVSKKPATKVTKKKAAPKKVLKKKVTKKKVTKKTAKAAPKVISSRVTRLREQLRRAPTTTTRVTIPEKQLSDDQLKKLKSGLTKSQMKHFRDLLVHKRAELLGDVASLASDVKSASQSISYEHMADTGTDNFEQEFKIELMESERALLKRIHDALTRIGNKTYGICILTGKPIGKARLEAKPWAKYSISIARELDRMGKL